LQDALNQQTFHQFKAYAEKQYPGNPEQQAVLIRQLQTEHYHQYMQQLQAQVVDGVDRRSLDGEPLSQSVDSTATQTQLASDDQQCDSDQEDFSIISPASMWTRPDIETFKQEVSAGKGDGVIRVGHGDTVTVRVPTHGNGSSLFWEFATDNYDVGFGVFFEWGKPLTTEVSVHISESDDDDGLDDEDELHSSDDLESGPHQRPHTPPTTRNRPLTTSIIPVYRRECQSEVYVGSHNYPGEGVYLLKFDNSYSLWRSKTLYYRVYYTR